MRLPLIYFHAYPTPLPSSPCPTTVLLPLRPWSALAPAPPPPSTSPWTACKSRALPVLPPHAFLSRRMRPYAVQAVALVALGPAAYRREGPGLVYCATRSIPGGQQLVKMGHAAKFPRRRAQYDKCAAPGSPITFHFLVFFPHRIIAERLIHLLLFERGAKIPPARCPGPNCPQSHREWFSLAAIGGFPGLERLLRRACRRLGLAFKKQVFYPAPRSLWHTPKRDQMTNIKPAAHPKYKTLFTITKHVSLLLVRIPGPTPLPAYAPPAVSSQLSTALPSSRATASSLSSFMLLFNSGNDDALRLAVQERVQQAIRREMIRDITLTIYTMIVALRPSMLSHSPPPLSLADLDIFPAQE
ncbi:hypothetical protein DFH09DRAFT_1328969 [Mycena vulgaris]|nr:hypothetical protein DFH09DRAFT_1328969 [Mycena vulgaris]